MRGERRGKKFGSESCRMKLENVRYVFLYDGRMYVTRQHVGYPATIVQNQELLFRKGTPVPSIDTKSQRLSDWT